MVAPRRALTAPTRAAAPHPHAWRIRRRPVQEHAHPWRQLAGMGIQQRYRIGRRRCLAQDFHQRAVLQVLRYMEARHLCNAQAQADAGQITLGAGDAEQAGCGDGAQAVCGLKLQWGDHASADEAQANHAMRVQRIKLRGRAKTLQVLRRGAGGEAFEHGHAACDQFAVAQRAIAQHAVDALFHQIHPAVAFAHHQLNLWVVRKERRQPGQQEVPPASPAPPPAAAPWALRRESRLQHRRCRRGGAGSVDGRARHRAWVAPRAWCAVAGARPTALPSRR